MGMTVFLDVFFSRPELVHIPKASILPRHRYTNQKHARRRGEASW